MLVIDPIRKLANTVTFDRDPRNIMIADKSKDVITKPPYRLLAFVNRICCETFDDTEGSPHGKGVWIEDISEEDWVWLRDKDIMKFLQYPKSISNEEFSKRIEELKAYVEKEVEVFHRLLL